MGIFRASLNNLYSWFLPYNCILCHLPSHNQIDLCQECENELPILPQSCPQCAKIVSTADIVCGECLKAPPPFTSSYALFSYKPPITKLIMDLKFHNKLINAAILGELLARAIPNWYEGKKLPDLVIPIPLHARRLRERGFNQALEIARPIIKKFKIPLDKDHCKRFKFTAPQARLIAKKRTDNIKNAFIINVDLKGKHVAVLDDVITTGQTVTEFSKALKKAGAKRIDIWACARALTSD